MLASLAVGCATPAPARAPRAPTRYGAVPSEAVHYGLAEEADAGFLRVRVETKPCGEGLMGVQVRLANTGPKTFETYRAEVSARRPTGDLVAPTRAPYDSPCRDAIRPQKLAPGEATTSWYVYPTRGPTTDLRVAIDLTEPDGLAIYKTVFHLDEDRIPRDVAAVDRPAAPRPQLAFIESPYYRLTVVAQRACRDAEHTSVSYEVVLESFTNVPLRLGLSELVDAQGRSYDGASTFRADRCVSAGVAQGGPVGDVPPGEKRRGWLYPIVLPADATGLSLHGSVAGEGLGGSDFAVDLGVLPEPVEVFPKLDPPPAPTSSLREALAPKPAPPPMFRDLAPRLKDARTYEPAKVLTLFKEHHRQRGNFLIGVVPTTTRLWAAGFYPEWTEKRYPIAKMVEQTREQFVSVATDKLFARLVLFHHADVMFHEGEHSLTVPDDLAEFVFLELDGQPPIRCSEAQIPLMSLVGPFSKQVGVVLVFDLPKGVAERIRGGKGTARFVVGGLGMPSDANHFDYPLPFDALTNDAPVELQRLFRALDAPP